MTAVLRIEDIKKSFGDVQAVRGVSFELRKGERLAVLGPNGAGKTTTIKCIAGRVIPDSGKIYLNGNQLAPSEHRDFMGVVPQELAIYGRLTARENLDVFARLHGVPAGEVADRVRWALEWTGLADNADRPTEGFSGGMKRRVNIACGVLHRPTVILLDEPTVGVDPQSRERIYDMLDVLRNEGASILLTTHQLEEAEVRCDRIVIVDQGRVVDSGTLSELVGRTVGASLRVTVAVEDSPDSLDGFTIDRQRKIMSTNIDNLARDLPSLLMKLEQARVAFRDVDVRPPSLQAVFLHLTGKELRE